MKQVYVGGIFDLFCKRFYHFVIPQGLRGGKFIPLKSVVDEAVRLSPCVEKVFVMDRTGDTSAIVGEKDVALEKVRH